MVEYNDLTLMPFGKYKGVHLANVPDSYLKHIYENYQLSDALKAYIEKNRKAIEQNIKRNNRNIYR